VRDALVAALVDCARSRPSRWRTRRFLTGLSSDELQFIAGYLGARILEFSAIWRQPCPVPGRGNVHCRCAGTAAEACQSHDREHKLILLVEFLGRSGLGHIAPLRTQAARWN